MAVLAFLSYSQRQVATRKFGWPVWLHRLEFVCVVSLLSHPRPLLIPSSNSHCHLLVSAAIFSTLFPVSSGVIHTWLQYLQRCPTQHPGLIISWPPLLPRPLTPLDFSDLLPMLPSLSRNSSPLLITFHNHSILIWVPAPFNYPSSLLLAN